MGFLLHFLVQFQPGDVSKVCYFFAIPDEFKIKSFYSNDLILNIASKIKETVQKLQFLDSLSFSSKNSHTYNLSAVRGGYMRQYPACAILPDCSLHSLPFFYIQLHFLQ